jgi:electron transfer flavoprotein alpha subunit
VVVDLKVLKTGVIEELATVMGAATACSKPVSDLGWRPHGEHVGQTGKPVAPLIHCNRNQVRSNT